MSYEEEDTSMSNEEEDTCMSYEEEDTRRSCEEEDTCMSNDESTQLPEATPALKKSESFPQFFLLKIKMCVSTHPGN